MKCCINTKATAELQSKVNEEISQKDPTKCCIASIINKGKQSEDTPDDAEGENTDNK
jgi:hypothetical protein